MFVDKKLIVSHAPFWHNGSCVAERNYNIMLAALPAVVFGIMQCGIAALGVISLAISSAMIWELAFTRAAKRTDSIWDGSAALIGMILGMLLPATTPWWIVIVGTFVAIVIGKQVYGGLGANPFNPALVALAILSLSWSKFLDFDAALVNYDFKFVAVYPLELVKHASKNPELFNLADVVNSFKVTDLLMGKQIGGIGSVFGAGIIVGGLYLIVRGFIRWEISLSFILGVLITALLFQAADPTRYACPLFHLLTGYTLLGAFFLATEDSSSPVNFIPMLLYGAGAGMMTVLIRNIGAYADGVLYAVLIMNLANPLLDKLRPKAIGKAV
jgi:electron transport complex protein RnfD